MKHSLLVVSLCLPLGACWMGRAQTNEPLDAVKAAQLVPGTSTASDVVALLGGPNDVVQLGRRTAYQYIATTEKSAGLWLFALALTNVDARQDRVWVFFDEQDVLTHIGSTFESHRAQWALPWQDVHAAEDAEARDRARPGVGQ